MDETWLVCECTDCNCGNYVVVDSEELTDELQVCDDCLFDDHSN